MAIASVTCHPHSWGRGVVPGEAAQVQAVGAAEARVALAQC